MDEREQWVKTPNKSIDVHVTKTIDPWAQSFLPDANFEEHADGRDMPATKTYTVSPDKKAKEVVVAITSSNGTRTWHRANKHQYLAYKRAIKSPTHYATSRGYEARQFWLTQGVPGEVKVRGIKKANDPEDWSNALVISEKDMHQQAGEHKDTWSLWSLLGY